MATKLLAWTRHAHRLARQVCKDTQRTEKCRQPRTVSSAGALPWLLPAMISGREGKNKKWQRARRIVQKCVGVCTQCRITASKLPPNSVDEEKEKAVRVRTEKMTRDKSWRRVVGPMVLFSHFRKHREVSPWHNKRTQG